MIVYYRPMLSFYLISMQWPHRNQLFCKVMPMLYRTLALSLRLLWSLCYGLMDIPLVLKSCWCFIDSGLFYVNITITGVWPCRKPCSKVMPMICHTQALFVRIIWSLCHYLIENPLCIKAILTFYTPKLYLGKYLDLYAMNS
jgi:hypothetical protein